MAYFCVESARSATKDLRGIDPQWVPKVLAAIETLADDPRPAGFKKLVGSDHTYRIRIGDHRVIYELQGGDLLVLVIRVRHRRDVYR